MEAYGPRNAQERTWRIIDAVGDVAEGRGVAMSRGALAWVADRPAVTSVILGARTVGQLDDNLGAAGMHLSDKRTELLTAASAPLVADYPYGVLGIEQRSHATFGRTDTVSRRRVSPTGQGNGRVHPHAHHHACLFGAASAKASPVIRC